MKLEILNTKTVFDGFFKIEEATLKYERYNGEMSEEVKRLSFERGDAVAGILWNKSEEKAILVEQFKYPSSKKDTGWIVEVVAGMVDQNETPESAIVRETIEETGFNPELSELISTFYVSPGGSSERIHLFYLEVSDECKIASGGGLASENEDIVSKKYSLNQLRNGLIENEFIDAKTIIAIQYLLSKQG